MERICSLHLTPNGPRLGCDQGGSGRGRHVPADGSCTCAKILAGHVLYILSRDPLDTIEEFRVEPPVAHRNHLVQLGGDGERSVASKIGRASCRERGWVAGTGR